MKMLLELERARKKANGGSSGSRLGGLVWCLRGGSRYYILVCLPGARGGW